MTGPDMVVFHLTCEFRRRQAVYNEALHERERCRHYLISAIEVAVAASEPFKVCCHTTTEEPHGCPFAVYVHNDDVFRCRCCDDCTHDCADDI